ncbi:MAG: hypothetical protein R3Y23_02965 [Bacillota bacterium]
MEDLELLKRAKMYINKLANGINPLDDSEVLDDSLLNEAKIIRCFFYIENKLGELIDGDKEPKSRKKKNRKLVWSVTDEDIKNFHYYAYPVSLSVILRQLFAMREDMGKCSYKRAAQILQDNCIFTENTVTPTPKFMATEDAKDLGIYNVEGTNERGHFLMVKFNQEGQQLVLALLKDSICDDSEAINNTENQE